MISLRQPLLACLITCAFVLGLGPSAFAQEEEFDPRKAVEEIQKDLDAIVEGLAELGTKTVNPEAGERVVENVDKLLEDLQKSQSRVVNNIDSVLKNMKSSKSSSSSSSSSSSQSQSQSQSQSGQQSGQQRPSGRQDRNQGREGRRENQSGNQPQGSQKPQGGKPEEEGSEGEQGGKDGEQEGQKPEGSQGKPKGGENQKSSQSKAGRQAPGSGRDVVAPLRDREGWGYLPNEVRQLLIEKNFRDYFPDYEREISDYLKSLNKRR